MNKTIHMTINGSHALFEVEHNERLIDTLREKAGLTGTKEGCGVGECGACSVLLNGVLVNSCLTLSLQADGCKVVTIEGLSNRNHLSDLQQAFLEEGAVQCGFCTPGMLMAAESILDRWARPTTEQIRSGLVGNLCRCTGYHKIVAAIRKTAKKRATRKCGR